MSFAVTLAIPTCNRARLLASTLAGMRSLSIPAKVDVEFLVVDNGSTDDTPAVLESAAGWLPAPLRCVTEPTEGLCHARNRILHEARHPYAAFLDDDIFIAPTWLEGLCEAVETTAADAVFGPVFPAFEESTPDYMTASILDAIGSSYSRQGEEMKTMPTELAHQLPGCNFAVARQVALDIGGFDPRLDRRGRALLAGGDTEFGRRMAEAGKRVVYHPLCRVRHVITAEKCSREYLRNRWYGLGVTRRMLDRMAEREPLMARRIRGHLGLARLAASTFWLRMRGESAASFERELQFRRALGYWRDPDRERA